MDQLVIPINDITRADNNDAQTFGDVLPTRRLPSGENYAGDEKVIAAIREELVPLIAQTRMDRQPLHEEWQAIRRMEHCIHDEGQRYRGRSNAYLPVYARLMSTQVSTLAKGLFPSDDYMDCIDRKYSDSTKAKDTKLYVQWEFERNAKLRKHMKVFCRQLKAFGNSPLKFLYRKERRYEGRKFNLATATLGMQQADAFASISYEGLQVSARSIFNWYVYPMTADSLEEATLVFEDIKLPRQYVESQIRYKRWLNGEEALNSTYVTEVELAQQDLHGNIHGVNQSDNGRGPLAQILTLTEAWTFLKLPKSAYVAGEDPNCAVPVMVILAGSTPVCVIRNPYFHQRPPYLFGRQNASPGMIYGYSVGKLARAMQYLANDFANQTNDAGAYSLNPIGIRNPALVAGPMRPIAPGVVWDFTDTDKGFRFERPPVELVQHGLNLASMYMNWAQELSGAPPQLSGVGTKSNTATGMQILQKNVSVPLQDEVEDMETEVMVPLMYGTWMNGQQFRDQDIMAAIAGGEVMIPKESLAIDAEFRWLASSQAMNSAQRAQQLTQFMQMVAPIVPLLMQQGYVVDFGPLLQRILGDGMGLRGVQDIIKKAQMAPMGGGPVPPEAMGGVMAEQGDRVRSAVEQAGGEMGSMAPGEGEAFMDVRSEADELAALLGSMGGS